MCALWCKLLILCLIFFGTPFAVLVAQTGSRLIVLNNMQFGSERSLGGQYGRESSTLYESSSCVLQVKGPWDFQKDCLKVVQRL
jgi:hypothetical protein